MDILDFVKHHQVFVTAVIAILAAVFFVIIALATRKKPVTVFPGSTSSDYPAITRTAWLKDYDVRPPDTDRELTTSDLADLWSRIAKPLPDEPRKLDYDPSSPNFSPYKGEPLDLNSVPAVMEPPQQLVEPVAKELISEAAKSFPRIVFCTTCKGRVQHLRRTLSQNMADNADYPNAHFVVLDYNDPGELQEYLKTEQAENIANGKLSVYGYYSWQGPFRMSHAKNLAHRCGLLEGADILVNMDADNYAAPGFASYIAEYAATMGLREFFLWSNAKSIIGRARQGLAGRTVLSKYMFLKVGGYDEKYTHWAPEDEDFKARIRRLGYEGVQINEKFLYVIPHKDWLRFKEYPEAKPDPEREAQSLKDIRNASTTIANYGNVGAGTVYKNFSKQPIWLGPIPTRVFGIGMHKTATTSLHTALKKLGVDSGHWNNPGWAKKIWQEMNQQGRSVTLEKYYAVCDLPITILFKQLDAAYPGSKFILTVKDEQKWLHDVKDHWGYDTNVHRATWDTDWFTHKLHNILYGRKDFDAEVFLTRYRAHNAEVKEYFKDRPNDLLVMNMDQGAGWKELCPFLNCPAPNDPYPRIESTRPEPIESFIKFL